jgi:hypothetical protein
MVLPQLKLERWLRAAEGGSSWIVTEEPQSSGVFIFDSGRTNQKLLIIVGF